MGLLKGIGEGVDIASKGVKSIFPDKYLEPQSKGEETFQDYASMVPLYFLGGGKAGVSSASSFWSQAKKLPAFFGKVAAGRGVGDFVESIGGGKIGNIISQIGVPAAFEMVNLKNIKSHFEPLKHTTFDKLSKIAGNKQVSADKISKALESAHKSSIGRKNQTLINKNLDDISKLIQNGKIGVKEIQPLNEKLGNLIYKDSLDVLDPVLHASKQTAKLDPAYAKELTQANSIHKFLQKLDGKIDDAENFISKTMTTMPTTKKYAAKKAAQALFGNPKVTAAGSLGEIAHLLPKEAGKYALKSLEAATKRNAGALTSSLTNLGRVIERTEKDKPSGFKIYTPTPST